MPFLCVWVHAYRRATKRGHSTSCYLDNYHITYWGEKIWGSVSNEWIPKCICVCYLYECFVLFMFWGKERKERGEEKRKAHGKVELCCYTCSFRNACDDTDTWFYILKTIYEQRQKASFVDCQHNKKRKSAGIKIYHNSRTDSSASLPGNTLHAFPHDWCMHTCAFLPSPASRSFGPH